MELDQLVKDFQAAHSALLQTAETKKVEAQLVQKNRTAYAAELRRKMEDAVAVSKRLKDVLSLHSSTKTAGAKAGANSSENDSRIQSKVLI